MSCLPPIFLGIVEIPPIEMVIFLGDGAFMALFYPHHIQLGLTSNESWLHHHVGNPTTGTTDRFWSLWSGLVLVNDALLKQGAVWGERNGYNLRQWLWSKTGYDWLVVWNHGILWLSIQLGISIHPNWLSLTFFRGVGWNHQPGNHMVLQPAVLPSPSLSTHHRSDCTRWSSCCCPGVVSPECNCWEEEKFRPKRCDYHEV